MRFYSHHFSCLYDEEQPIGKIGRGSHYSVFRATEWRNVKGQPISTAEIHDFAVIWDEDHDDRVIGVAERLYVNGLFSPVQFIGERKGMLTIIVASLFRWWGTEQEWMNWSEKVRLLSENVHGDIWAVEFGTFDKKVVKGFLHGIDPSGIISESDERAVTYLRNIDNLWNLGTWPYRDRFDPNSVCGNYREQLVKEPAKF